MIGNTNLEAIYEFGPVDCYDKRVGMGVVDVDEPIRGLEVCRKRNTGAREHREIPIGDPPEPAIDCLADIELDDGIEVADDSLEQKSMGIEIVTNDEPHSRLESDTRDDWPSRPGEPPRRQSQVQDGCARELDIARK
jgi:hypothetical protein